MVKQQPPAAEHQQSKPFVNDAMLQILKTIYVSEAV